MIFESVQEKYMRERIQACLGSVVEVFTVENHLLFIGKTENYDANNQELWVQLHKGGETPQGMLYKTPVKIQVHPGQGWGELVMIYGNLTGSAAAEWRVQVTNVVSCLEMRRAFRQKVREEGWLLWGKPEEQREKCRLEDISSVGVGFWSAAELEKGTEIRLVIPHLIEGGPQHTLKCRVVVCRTVEGQQMRRYGCTFEEVSEREEDLLCGDLLKLQAKTIRRDK